MLEKLAKILFQAPRTILALIAAATFFFAWQIPGIGLYSDFADLLPQRHPYIKLHSDIRNTFGGANVVIVGIETKGESILTNEGLALIDRVTQAVDMLPGVNHHLVTSLTHRNSRKLSLSAYGNIQSDAYFNPSGDPLNDQELEDLKGAILSNPRVYGPLVSPDLKAALVKAQLNENRLDYEKTFAQLQEIRRLESSSEIEIHITGQPVLMGWVYTYKEQILQIFLYTAIVMLAILIAYFRTTHGVILPLVGVFVSATWGLGILRILGYQLDPLGLVVPFLISARAMSHGIQLIERYDQERAESRSAKESAERVFAALFRPGSLGIISDAIGISLIAIGSIPINTKTAVYASLWALSVLVTVLVAIPLLLSLLPQPHRARTGKGVGQLLFRLSAIIAAPRSARTILIVAVTLFSFGLFFSSWVRIGESEAGSPILYRDHNYNRSSTAINERFPGSEELYIVAETPAPGGIKEPRVLRALSEFERGMLLDPGVGAAKGVPGLVREVNRLLHNTDPGFAQIPNDPAYVGGLFFTYMAASPIPGALNEFIDPKERLANLVFFYKDRRGETIRRAMHMANSLGEEAEEKVEGLHIRLAGGTIGVTAAMNEASYRTNVIVLPLVFGLIFAAVSASYASLHAGLIMMLSMLFATTLTYAYMGWASTGININTVPIIAIGVGIGIDYSIYMMDRIREAMRQSASLAEAIKAAVSTTGRAIALTATTLMAGIILWVILSELRFQAEAALLLCIMIVLNALAALFIVPAWVSLFEPRFLTSQSD